MEIQTLVLLVIDGQKLTSLYGKGRARVHCLTIAYRMLSRRKGTEVDLISKESRLPSRNASNGGVKDPDAPARTPAGDLGRLLRHNYHHTILKSRALANQSDL